MKSKKIPHEIAKACMDKYLHQRKVGGLTIDTWRSDGWDFFNNGMRIHLVKDNFKTVERRHWFFFKKTETVNSKQWHEIANYSYNDDCFIIEEGFEDLIDSVNMIVDYLIDIGKVAIQYERTKEEMRIEERKRIASEFLGA